MRVEQLLHGYSDGHRLLAASKELPRGAKHTVLALSDMSGRSMVPGFEEYVTAYPVPGTDYYAFAKTWYAPEMERPGCVWTHTLLIDASGVAALDDISRLDVAFRRPSEGGDFEHYAAGFELPAQVGSTQPSAQPETSALPLLAALYSAPEAPVIVPVGSSRSLQGLVFAIWNQQWPRLRRTFSFCTGAISSRSLAGRPLDVQLVPDKSMRELARDLPGAVFVSERTASAVAFDPWVLAAADDLRSPIAGLRAFLLQFGDALGARPFFEPLTELRACLGDGAMCGSLEQLIEVVSEHFPGAREAAPLKAALLGRSAPLCRLLYSREETDVLRAIAAATHAEAFDAADLQIADRTRQLWIDHREEGERLADHLLNRDHNVLGEEMLTALVSIVPAEQIAVFFRTKPSLLVSAVRRDPRLATSPALWSGPADLQRELFDAAIGGLDRSDALGRDITAAMLDAGSDAAAEQAVQKLKYGVDHVLAWFDSASDAVGSPVAEGGDIVLSENWRRCLRERRGDVLAWALSSRRQPRSMALVAQILDPHAQEVEAAGLEAWLDAATNVAELSEEEKTRLHAFALALAFDVAAPQSSALTVLTFETVHTAAEEKRLGYEAWSLFEDHVPALSSYRNWDKCERLRRGLVDRFDSNEWPVRMFIGCARRLDTFTALLRTCDDYKSPGKHLLKRMSRESEPLLAALPSEWRSTFRRYVRTG